MGAAIGGIIAGVGALGAAGIGAATAPGTSSGRRALRMQSRQAYRMLPEYARAIFEWEPRFTRQNIALQRRTALSTGNTLATLGPMAQRLEQQRLGRETGLISQFAPGVRQALAEYNPAGAGLLGELEYQAGTELEARQQRQLTPDELRNTQQYIRAGQSQRGMGYGPTDVYDEAMRLALTGREAQQQSRQFAAGTINLGQQFYGDPYERIFKASGAAPTTPAGLLAAGGGQVRRTGVQPIYGASSGSAPMDSTVSQAAFGLSGGLLNTAGGLYGQYLSQQRTPPPQTGYFGGNPYPTTGNQSYQYPALNPY